MGSPPFGMLVLWGGVQIDEAGPAAFRTRGALTRTMYHLRQLMDQSDFSLVHQFLFDRYRSVRQDLYVQGIEVMHLHDAHFQKQLSSILEMLWRASTWHGMLWTSCLRQWGLTL